MQGDQNGQPVHQPARHPAILLTTNAAGRHTGMLLCKWCRLLYAVTKHAACSHATEARLPVSQNRYTEDRQCGSTSTTPTATSRPAKGSEGSHGGNGARLKSSYGCGTDTIRTQPHPCKNIGKRRLTIKPILLVERAKAAGGAGACQGEREAAGVVIVASMPTGSLPHSVVCKVHQQQALSANKAQQLRLSRCRPATPAAYAAGPVCLSGESTRNRLKERMVSSEGLSPWCTACRQWG